MSNTSYVTNISSFALVLLLLHFETFATKLTVDADGGSSYTTISAALNASNSGDTIYIQGSDIDTYDETWPADRSPDLTIMGSFSNPDSFPVVRFSGGYWSNYWQNGGIATTRFERIVINNWPTISLLNNQRNCVINKCIIKSFSSIVFTMSGDHVNYLIITNTIFWNNTGTIFSSPSNHNVNGPYANVFNCTFYNNQTINAESNVTSTDVANNKIVLITNSIFKNNSNIVTDTDIKPAYTYNLLPNGQSGWGTGSVYNDNPGFINSSPQKASDFGLVSSAPAKDAGTSTDMPTVDITGGSRTGTYDIGAYEYGSGGSSSGSNYYWDNSTSSGYQISNGTWGSNNYWSTDGTALVAWPGAGKSATFAGSDGTWTITVNGTQNVDSIAFLNNGYTISGGTALNFSTKPGVFVDASKYATISTVISGSPGVSKYGAGTLTLSGSNTYTGNTVINAGTLVANSNTALGNTSGTTILSGGSTPTVLQLGNVTITNETVTLNSDSVTSAISQIYVPASTTATFNGPINFAGGYRNKIITDGTLNVQGTINGNSIGWIFLYLGGSGTGTMNSTVSIGNIHFLKDGTGTWTINSSGNTWNATCVNEGILKNGITNALPTSTIMVIGANDASNVTYNMNGYSQEVKGITDGGTTGGTKQITNTGSVSTLTINNNIEYTYSYPITSAINIVKNGSAKFTLAGVNTYTGTTTVSAGNLCINGSTASASAVSVASGATLSGTGTISGTISISNSGIITPGDGGTSTLSTGSLTLNSTSNLNFELGSSSDRIAVSGNLILDGTLNITNTTGFGVGTYTIMTYTGSLTNNTLSLGTVPSGYDYTINASGGNVTVTVTGSGQSSGLTWDTNTGSGYQAGNGTWGTNNYWSSDGTNLVAWPGAGKSATFAGSDGSWTITVNGTQNVDSIAFLNNGYNISGGTSLNFSTKPGVFVDASKSATIGTAITGNPGLIKYGTGTLILGGVNTYSGATIINAGTLVINGSTASGSAVTVSSGAILAGTGTASGSVNASGGTISPGNTGTGTLSTGALTLNSSSNLNYELGSSSDRITVNGNLTLDGILNITNVSGFGASTYTIMTYSGSLTNNTLSLGTVPSGYDYSISASGGNVNVTVSVSNPGNTVTIDADGAADYNSLDTVLKRIQSGLIDPDTVKFIGSNQHTYSWTIMLDKSISYIVFKGAETDPDKFPIINHTKEDEYNFFNKTDAHFQRVIITGTLGFRLGQSAHSFSFKQCVIRDVSGTYAFNVEGTLGGTVIFENCLFEGNQCTNIFDLNYWGGTPTFTITNCTFDNNTSIWDEDEDQYTNFSIKNCIFSNNGTVFRGNNLRGKTIYSLTSEALTGYGTGCVSNSNPQYVSGSRSNPSDWKIGGSSPADNIGTSTGTPSFDLGGNTRVGSIDAGCWYYDAIINYYWDVNSAAGYQAGNGTWGTNSFWTADGTNLVAWPGAGKSATFPGSDGTWTINVNGIQNVDSIAFVNDGYTITDGTALNFSTKPGVFVDVEKTGTIITPITGTPGLSKYGTGTLILGGPSTFSGPVKINAGVMSTSYLNNGGSSSNLGSSSNSASNLIFNGGTLRYTGVIQNCDRLFTMSTNGGTIDGSGIGALIFTNTGSMAFSGTGSRTLTLTGSCTGNVLSIAIGDNSGSTSIIKSGSGSWILTGNNTATGTVTISAGTLQIGNAGSTGSITGAVTNNSKLIFNRSNSYTYSQIISGSGTVTHAGAGTLILSGANTYNGTTTVNSGTLQLGAINVIPDGSGKGDLILNGTLDLNSYNETINGLNGDGTIDNSSAGTPVLTIGSNNTNSIFSGVIKNSAGTLAITKTGSGIITLSGVNTYTGSTIVSAGELRINGSISTGSTVQSGATLGGNGTIDGSVIISNGGIINPGNGATGTLSTRSLTLNSTSILNFELGNNSDRIIVNGNLGIDGIINIANSGGFDLGEYILMTCTGTIIDNGLSIGIIPLSSYNYSVVINGGNVCLRVTSKEEMLPLTVIQAAPVCSVYTNKWTLVFDNNRGGGIKALTDSIHGLHHGQGNQIGGSQSLFFLEYSGTSSKQNGTWSVNEVGSFRTMIRQSGTLTAGISYVTDYTIHGSGKIYLKSTIYNYGSDVSGKVIRFGCERSPITTMAVFTGNSTASQSPFVLLSSNASLQNDILLSIMDLWSARVGILNSATGFYNSTITGYAGYECNNFSLSSGQRQSMEFMIDFSHQNWNDTNGVGIYSNDYRSPDSLIYLAGTPAMEQDWEQHLFGHWKFDEDGSVDTARDASGNNHYGTISGGSWTSGMLGGGIGMNGSQSVTIRNNSDFNGNVNFTVMAWIKPSVAISTGSVIIGKHNGTQGWKFSGDGTGRLCATLNGSIISGITSAISTGSWHHVAVSWHNDGAVIFYVDGNVDKVLSGSYSVSNNSANVIIGSGFNGIIDDMRYYNEVIPENTMKSIYRNGIRSSEGVYDTRASDDNSLHVLINGENTPRRFPVFRIANYWATSKPAAGCVRLNGIALTEGTDYYVDLIDGWNLLYIGLNRTIMSNSVRLYIDDGNSKGAVVRSTPKMVCGKLNNGSVDYLWVKNFNSNTFGNSSSKQWYVNWKMTENGGKDGDPWFMASSVTNPENQIDTARLTNLIPGSDWYNDSWGSYCFKIGSYFPKTSADVSSLFTYTVEESSSVRVVLRVNERTVSNNGSSFKVITRWTIYPTGQFFKWDSMYSFSGAPSHVYASASMDDTTYSTFYLNRIKKRGGVIYSSKFQDFAYAWLSMKNSSGYQAQPFDSDTILTWLEASRVGMDFGDSSATSVWNSSSIQSVVYLDMQNANMNSAFIDSVSNSVQYPQTPVMITGSLLSGGSATEGDLNGDGFNEREGAYAIKSYENEIHLRLPAHGDTCRSHPAFKISNYTSTYKPQHVVVYRGSDTVTLSEGYHYNAYLNKSKKELVIQIDSVFRDTTSIFISSDKTLAVKLSSFSAAGGDNCDTLRWRTESEKDNLGFYLFRRICPEFIDSLMKSGENVKKGNVNDTGILFKNKIMTHKDTVWIHVNERIISGAASGASYGPRDYIYIDYDVSNEVLYEYKLIAVDYNNEEKNYGPVKVIPRKNAPLKFVLYRNFPNPFRAATFIRFTLPENSKISLNIYNLQGKLVKKLVRPDRMFHAGTYQVMWDGKSATGGPIATGPYVYRFVAGKYIDTKVMLLIK